VLAEVAVRVSSTPVELLLDLGGNVHSEIGQYTSVPTLAEQAKAQLFLTQVGARGSAQVLRTVALHASLCAGLQSQSVRTVLPLSFGEHEESGLAARLALAGGATWRVGPGRALAQLQFDWASAHVAQLAGSTSGVQLMLGYLVAVK